MNSELSKDQKRSRSCLFFHDWNKWMDRAEGVHKFSGNVRGQVVIQERRCETCNAIDFRTVRS